MGSRDNFQTVTCVIQGFASQHTWRQAELARHVGVQPRALRRLLLGLRESGMPLESEEEHPHVYWSVPPHWFPGGVVFDLDDWQVLVHAVLRIADPQRRTKLLGRLLAGRRTVSVDQSRLHRLDHAVDATPLTPEEHAIVLLVEESILEQVPLSIRYFSASRGEIRTRAISPQKLIMEPHGRVAAYCHTNRALRWFRTDNIERASLDRGQAWQEVDAQELERFLSSSVDGYRDGTDEELAFCVRSPESNWVRRNLLPGMTLDEQARTTELRVVARGAAVVVARYIVGLGGAAVAETAALRGLVRHLAEATLKANR